MVVLGQEERLDKCSSYPTWEVVEVLFELVRIS